MLQRLPKLIRILQLPDFVLPKVKKYKFSTSELILAFLTEAPGAPLLANQILDRLKVVDSDWVAHFEECDDIKLVADRFKRRYRARMCLTQWAQDWFEGFLLASMLLGLCVYVSQRLTVVYYMVRSESHRNPESSVFSPNEICETLKAQLWLRDGCRTPFLGSIDPQAPRDEVVKDPALPNDFTMFADIGHILPFWISGRPVVYSYLRIFGNISIPFEEMQATLFKPPNAAVFDVAWRNFFNRFSISIQYDPAMDDYILRSYEPTVPLIVSQHKDQPLVGLHAGSFTDIEYRLSGEFCNIHHAISKILYTAGAAQVINEILDVEVGARETGVLCLCEEFHEDGSDCGDEEFYSFSRARYQRAGIDLLDRRLSELATARAMCITPDVGWKRNSSMFDMPSS